MLALMFIGIVIVGFIALAPEPAMKILLVLAWGGMLLATAYTIVAAMF